MTSSSDSQVFYEKPAEGTEDEYEEEERMVPPDGGWGWIIVISGFFAHVLSDGVMYAFGVILENLMEVFNATATDVSFAGSLLPGVILGIGPLACTLITIYGARAITIAGGIIAGISLGVSAFAPSLLFVTIFAGVFCGIGFGVVYLPAIVMVSYYFERRRSIAMGLTVVGSGIGAMIFPPLLSFLIKEYQWRGTFAIMGALVLNCVACGLVLLPLKPQKVWVKKRQSTNDDVLLTLANSSEESSRPSEGKIGKDLVDIVDEKFFSSSHRLNGSHTSLQVTPDHMSKEEEEEGREGVSPLLMTRKTSENVLFVPNDKVKYRRGISHSPGPFKPQRQDIQSPHTIGPTSPRSAFRHERKIIHHKSQLLPDQRLNPDVFMRPDLRYPASLTHIPLYLSNRDLFVHQVSHYVSTSSIAEDVDAVEEEEDFDRRRPNLWNQIVTSLRNSFDFMLFKDVPFLLFTISSFITSLGYNAPYIYIVAWGKQELEFDESSAAWLSSCIGIGNIIGRIFFGIVADHPKVSRMLLYIVALTMCGAVTVISPLFNFYWWMVGFATVFGILIGAYVSLTPLLIVDLLGLHRLDVAFGILGLVQCVATLAGPPVLAHLRDTFGSYSVLFIACGAVIGFSGLMLLPVYLFYKKLRTQITSEERDLGRCEDFIDGSSDSGEHSDSFDDSQPQAPNKMCKIT